MKNRLKYYLVMFASVLMFGAACTSEDGIVSPEDPTADRLEESESDKVFGCTPDEVDFVYVSREEAEALGLLTVPFEDPEFHAYILRDRITRLDMHAPENDTVYIDLLSPANVRWSIFGKDREKLRVKIANNTYMRGVDWIYNPCKVDYGPITAESVSPTRIKIVRKEGDWSEQPPVNVYLERQFIGMVPDELGVQVRISVKLSDTPEPIDPNSNTRLLTIEEADALGFMHMPFDSEEILAPIFKEGNELTVMMPEKDNEITVELDMPATLTEYMPTNGQFVGSADGIVYYDMDLKEMIFYPVVGSVCDNLVKVRMDDPLHVTLNIENFRNSPTTIDTLYVLLQRGDPQVAPEAGAVVGEIKIVRP